ncbi:MAG TPA: DNA polymerase III subunit delta [Planctomycetaceae bacterium]|nr:DNA polymerase III subunit delta [Planctomycetaceae bacterium]
MSAMHATEFLKAPRKHEPGPIAVLYGDERHLKGESLHALARTVLGADADELGLTRFTGTGKDLELKTVTDELLTVSMWGERRVVAVDDADEFVTQHRAALEKYLDKPARRSVLVLVVKTWPKTTRLYKAVSKIGLNLECSELKGAALLGWLVEQAAAKHGKRLARDAAALMVELAGTSLALLDQELAKLASYAGQRPGVDADDVRTLVGGWRAETTWAMLDALTDGQVPAALQHLDQLLTTGEAPQMILGALVYRFRQLAEATERARQGAPLRAALKDAGVWGNKVESASQYLRRIGRPRAERLYDALVAADADMKGGSRLPERVQLERLVVELGRRSP